MQHNRYFLLAKTLNKSDVTPRNRALDPRDLEFPSPIFETLTLSLVSFPQTVESTTFDPYLLHSLQHVITGKTIDYLGLC